MVDPTKQRISPIMKQTLMLTLTLFSILFIGAGIVTFVDDSYDSPFGEKLQFHDSIYYMLVTGSTIGYGDIYPMTAESRLIVCCLVIICFSIFSE